MHGYVRLCRTYIRVAGDGSRLLLAGARAVVGCRVGCVGTGGCWLGWRFLFGSVVGGRWCNLVYSLLVAVCRRWFLVVGVVAGVLWQLVDDNCAVLTVPPPVVDCRAGCVGVGSCWFGGWLLFCAAVVGPCRLSIGFVEVVVLLFGPQIYSFHVSVHMRRKVDT
eukprot:9504176-Pyramimonas_sp.AAC.1